ncbi:MAG: hypothetical protein MN733_21540, partial [Nitrososphaera sp.]|nr:hypothetical protein [Nitrososphaera sp.]
MIITAYYETRPPELGQAMHRIRRYFRHYSPPTIRFVNNAKDADLQIIDVVGRSSLRHIECPRIVGLVHCLLTSDVSEADWWFDFLCKCVFAVGHLSIESSLGFSLPNYMQLPWGVDERVFHMLPHSEHSEKRDFAVLTSGYCLRGEAIEECFLAAKKVSRRVCHLNRDFNYG